MRRTEIVEIVNNPQIGEKVLVKGWVKAFRSNRFIALNDGTTFGTFQVVVDFENLDEDTIKKIGYHAGVAIEGTLVESQGSGQAFELMAEKVEVLGANDLSKYPIQPKRQTMEFLRENAHFRMRTNTFSAVFKIRHGIAYAIHKYFNDHGYYYMNTPIITGSDAEGAGEMFQVSTLDPAYVPLTEDGAVDYSKDFFGKPTHLTVSGQLQGEVAALALGKVYTFGPTFRAENSNTSRHLAEFWMVEPEVAFHDIFDTMDLAEDFLKYLINYTLENYIDELAFLDKRIQDAEKNMKKELRRPMGLLETLKFVVADDFARITYTEAIDLLKRSKPYKKGKFEFPVEWGEDLAAEHERWLVEKKFKKPVMVTDYPASFKAFYMYLNDDKKTVRGLDVLFPQIGEVIGGAQREDRYDVLMERVKKQGIPVEEIQWYLDLRRFGGVPHGGFGLGFERIVLFITGMTNIRDVIAFPRTPGNAEF